MIIDGHELTTALEHVSLALPERQERQELHCLRLELQLASVRLVGTNAYLLMAKGLEGPAEGQAEPGEILITPKGVDELKGLCGPVSLQLAHGHLTANGVPVATLAVDGWPPFQHLLDLPRETAIRLDRDDVLDALYNLSAVTHRGGSQMVELSGGGTHLTLFAGDRRQTLQESLDYGGPPLPRIYVRLHAPYLETILVPAAGEVILSIATPADPAVRVPPLKLTCGSYETILVTLRDR